MRDYRRIDIPTFPCRVAGCLLMAAWLLVVPLGLAAQPAPTVEALIAHGTQAGLDAELMQQVARRVEQGGGSEAQAAGLLRPAVQLAEQELPGGGVLKKALEGLAKRVPPPRIKPVLQQMQTHTVEAGTVIQAWAARPTVRAMAGGEGGEGFGRPERDRLVESAVQARLQDVPADVVQDLLDAVPAATQRRPVPAGEMAAALQVLPEFLGDGASPQATIQLLTNALDAGYGPSNLRQLPTAMRVARQQTPRPADMVARHAARAIAEGTPAADVLGRLFDGGLPGGAPGGMGPPGGGPPGQGKPPDTPPGRGGNPTGNGPPGQGGNGG